MRTNRGADASHGPVYVDSGRTATRKLAHSEDCIQLVGYRWVRRLLQKSLLQIRQDNRNLIGNT